MQFAGKAQVVPAGARIRQARDPAPPESAGINRTLIILHLRLLPCMRKSVSLLSGTL